MATPPIPLSGEVVGNSFVDAYYRILDSSPEIAFEFYQDSSVLSRPDHNGVVTSVTTKESINRAICSSDFKNCAADIKTTDIQDSYLGGVIILVTGSLTGKDNRTRTFTQTFFLAPQGRDYYVLNDVLRYVEACEPSKNAEITVMGDSSTPLIQDQAPPHAINLKMLDQAISHEAGAPNVHEHLEEERKDKNWEEIVVEDDSHLNDKYCSSVLESSIDAPKKSSATIVGSETRKGPLEVYVPEVPALIKTEMQVGDSVVTPEALPPATGSFALSDSKVSKDEDESYSIYIQNLPPNLTVGELETEFKRFGPIKQDGVQVRISKRGGFCFGFVEFEELSSMQSAILASPIKIGTYEGIVEMKRPKRRVSGGSSSYSGERGAGYGRSNSGNQSSEFRGRGRG